MAVAHVLVALCGGLGNQMFQYAAGRALALRHLVPLLLDTSWYDNVVADTLRKYMLHAFPVQGRIAREDLVAPFRCQSEKFHEIVVRKFLGRPRPLPIGLVKEPHFHHWEGLHLVQPPAYLVGYWQSEQYFADYASVIRSDFKFPPLPDGVARNVEQGIFESPHPVAVHVRRGDYVSNPQANATHGVCAASYYGQAIAHVAEQHPGAKLFLFSDDPAWVCKHFDTQGLPATVVDLAMSNEPWHDMHLMSLCKHHIIANSSFSWWGAWLGEKGGDVYAPKQWFVSSSKQGMSPCPERWNTL
jgi:hypothetical protein